MPGRRFFRYSRRMLRAAGGGFARDERGSVLALTIAFALPLAYFVFVSYNTGVGLLTRMRAQNVADAASYSASLWQARFLNYCAYSRRHMVGNFATIALCTSFLNSKEMLDNIYNAKRLDPTFHNDASNGFTIKIQITLIKYGMAAMEYPLVWVREGADFMNAWLSGSQKAMFFAVGLDTTTNIMDQVVKDASGRQDTNFELVNIFNLSNPEFASFGSLLLTPNFLTSGFGLPDDNEIPKDEVKKYFDTYTNALCPNWIGLLGRSKYSGWLGFWFPPPGITHPSGFIILINILSEALTINSAGTEMQTGDHVFPPSMYCFGLYAWIYPFGIPIPIMIPPTPIFLHSTKDYNTYTLKTTFAEATVFEMADNKPKEPSCFAVVRADEETVPYFRSMGLLPSDLLVDEDEKEVLAFSRSKIYYRGWQETLSNGSNVYHGQDLNYPFWGAQLAPIGGRALIPDLNNTTLILTKLIALKYLGVNQALSRYPEY